MGLSNAQLLMLDNLIYANCCDNGMKMNLEMISVII